MLSTQGAVTSALQQGSGSIAIGSYAKAGGERSVVANEVYNPVTGDHATIITIHGNLTIIAADPGIHPTDGIITDAIDSVKAQFLAENVESDTTESKISMPVGAITPMSLPVAEGSVQSPIDHVTINPHKLFRDFRHKQLWIGDTIVVLVQPNEEVAIKLASTGARLNNATIQLDAQQGLALWTWCNLGKVIQPAALAPVAGWPNANPGWTLKRLTEGGNSSLQTDEFWPSPGHHWEFTLLDLEQEFPLNEAHTTMMAFDRSQVQVAWKMRHQAKGKSPETFLILLAKIDTN